MIAIDLIRGVLAQDLSQRARDDGNQNVHGVTIILTRGYTKKPSLDFMHFPDELSTVKFTCVIRWFACFVSVLAFCYVVFVSVHAIFHVFLENVIEVSWNSVEVCYSAKEFVYGES